MTDDWDPQDCSLEHTPEFDRIVRLRTIGVPSPYSGAVIRAVHEAFALGREAVQSPSQSRPGGAELPGGGS